MLEGRVTSLPLAASRLSLEPVFRSYYVTMICHLSFCGHLGVPWWDLNLSVSSCPLLVGNTIFSWFWLNDNSFHLQHNKAVTSQGWRVWRQSLAPVLPPPRNSLSRSLWSAVNWREKKKLGVAWDLLTTAGGTRGSQIDSRATVTCAQHVRLYDACTFRAWSRVGRLRYFHTELAFEENNTGWSILTVLGLRHAVLSLLCCKSTLIVPCCRSKLAAPKRMAG